MPWQPSIQIVTWISLALFMTVVNENPKQKAAAWTDDLEKKSMESYR